MVFPQKMATKPYLLQTYSREFLTIDCGDWTYGHPTLEVAMSDVKRTLKIGRFCSIGPEVRIFVGNQGRHATGSFSTYPLRMSVTPDVLAQSVRPKMALREPAPYVPAESPMDGPTASNY